MALSALALAACGGGGGGSAPPPSGNPGPRHPLPRRSFHRHSAAAPSPTPKPRVSCCRRSSRSPTPTSPRSKPTAIAAWLNVQYGAAPGQTGVAWLDSRGHNSITSEQRYFWPQFGDFMIWNQLLAGSGPDAQAHRARAVGILRRVAEPDRRVLSAVRDRRVLGRAVRELLTATSARCSSSITLNAGMGFFLNTKGNLKEDANGRQPDENYAREVMQLFTIGLYELNADGTLPARRQQQPDRDLRPERHHQSRARVHGLRLGLSIERRHVHQRGLARLRRAQHALRHEPDEVQRRTNHSNLAVTFLGTTIPANTPGPEALRIALDRLFNHANTGPFFARQMIQRLVTSNPSPAYVGRVAAAFANNGCGRARRSQGGVDRDPHRRRSAHRARGVGHAVGQVARAGRALRAVGAHRRRRLDATAHFEIYDLSGSDQALGQSRAAFAVGVQFLPPGLRAAEHRRSPPPANRRRNSSCSTKPPPRATSTSCRA